LAYNYDLKRKIAKLAAESVNDGEVVMIESGSTCAILADELAHNKKDITIITNSVFIATYVRKSETVHVILLGGEYQKDAQVNVGPLVKKVISDFRVDKLFAGIDGVDFERGFIGTDISRVDTTRSMSASAKEVIVLTDSSKFGSGNGVITEFAFDEVKRVYTDSGIEEEARELIEDRGIELFLV
jgi:DeoR/GlpR family transcriptional regulator of sugar metabolism